MAHAFGLSLKFGCLFFVDYFASDLIRREEGKCLGSPCQRSRSDGPEGSCCGGSGVRPLLPSPSEVADAPRDCMRPGATGAGKALEFVALIFAEDFALELSMSKDGKCLGCIARCFL